MIKLLVFLFTFAAVYAQESVFSLPDHHSRFIHQLDCAFKNSSQILIFTPALHHSLLKKELLDAIKQGSALKLIVHDSDGDPRSLIQYKNIDLSISAFPLNQSIILIDDTLACTSDGAIDEELFSSRRSAIHCSSDPHKIRVIRHTLDPLLRHAKSYLE